MGRGGLIPDTRYQHYIRFELNLLILVCAVNNVVSVSGHTHWAIKSYTGLASLVRGPQITSQQIILKFHWPVFNILQGLHPFPVGVLSS